MRVIIDKLGINGEGVARINKDETSKVCFVDFSMSNECVDIEIIEEKKKYCRAKLLKIIDNMSPDRVEPKCKYFSVCGGCDLQHMNTTMQKLFKSQKIAENLNKIAGIPYDVSDTIRLNDFEYRNKMVFMFVPTEKSIEIGMYERNSHNLVPIDRCLISNNIINDVLKYSNIFFKSKFVTDYKFIKFLVVRNIENQILITIVSEILIDLKDYYEYLCNNFKGFDLGVSIIKSDNGDDILSGEYKYLFGLKHIVLNEFGIQYKIDNRGFLQVNNEIKKLIYKNVLDMVDANDIVIDAYSGAGLLSAIVSKKCNKVIGIEINESAYNSALNLKEDNLLNNIDFINDDVKKSLNLSITKDCVLILDPPRAGCDKEVLDIIINPQNLPKKIIYISCDTATLSRDLKILNEKYAISEIIPYDMFPQTKHVETLVVLERKE